MITKSQKKRIKKILGNRYVSEVQKELSALGELNTKGNEYSSSHITNIMNGQLHTVIETTIFSLVQKTIVEQENLSAERNAILKA
jgi:hypothetical protein